MPAEGICSEPPLGCFLEFRDGKGLSAEGKSLGAGEMVRLLRVLTALVEGLRFSSCMHMTALNYL